MNNYFCGWYFKCQSGERTLALIPAIHVSGNQYSCSVQLISNTDNWNISLPSAHAIVRKDRPFAVLGSTVFREDGLDLELHEKTISATGSLQFSSPSPIRYDIMVRTEHATAIACYNGEGAERAAKLRPVQRQLPKLQWEGTGLTAHCLSFYAQHGKLSADPPIVVFDMRRLKRGSIPHIRVTQQAELVVGSGGRRLRPFMIWRLANGTQNNYCCRH